MTDETEHPAITDVRTKAEALADALQSAIDQGVGPAILMPLLFQVFQASGLPMPGRGALDSIRG